MWLKGVVNIFVWFFNDVDCDLRPRVSESNCRGTASSWTTILKVFTKVN